MSLFQIIMCWCECSVSVVYVSVLHRL